MKTKLSIPVIFRIIGTSADNSDNGLIAFLPTLPHNYGTVACYEHVGQHGEADYDFAVKGRLAKPEEYKNLLKELRAIYDIDEQELVVRKRIRTYWTA